MLALVNLIDDDNILRRSPFSATRRHSRHEREADAFASMFLTPAWLLALRGTNSKFCHRAHPLKLPLHWNLLGRALIRLENEVENHMQQTGN